MWRYIFRVAPQVSEGGRTAPVRLRLSAKLLFLAEDEHVNVMLYCAGLLVEKATGLNRLGGIDGLKRMEYPTVNCVSVDDVRKSVGCHSEIVVFDSDDLRSGNCLVNHNALLK